MAAAILRHITVLATIAAILFPQASGLLASLGLSRGLQVVICAGDGLRVISLDSSEPGHDGGENPLHCVLTHAIGTDASPPEPGLYRLAWRIVRWTEPGAPEVGETVAAFGARAPPSLVI